ncbi:unnamed protein product [Urochloa humidicola]
MDYKRLALVLAVATAMAWCSPEMTISGVAAWGTPQPPLPCMYIFGDSLVDNGNNNNILSLARANYRPYGIDFHEGPPGRFTNGRTMVDFLSDMLGLRPPLVPPYATARPSDLPRGLNFASGASGVLTETGNNLGGHYPLSQQVDHFRAAVAEMANSSSSSAAMFHGNATKVAEHMGRCIFFVGMGSNDYLNNYFMPDYYNTAQRYSPRDYATLLLREYAAQIAALYALGARKFVVAGVGQIGCIPYELARMNNDDQPDTPSSTSAAAADVGSQDIAISIGIGGGYGVGGGIGGGGGGGGGGMGRSSSTSSNTNTGGGGAYSTPATPDTRGGGAYSTPANPDAGGGGGGGGCNETINSVVAMYNRGLLAMVKRYNGGGGGQGQMRGARFVYLDTVASGKDLAANAAAHGFTVLDRGCCGVGRNNGQITCLPLQRPCDDRAAYIFWDAFHPTEAANRIYAAKAYGSNNTAEVYPINVRQLAAS